MILSAVKFKNLLTKSIYVCTGKDFAEACKVANRNVKKENRQFLGTFNQSETNTQAWHDFLKNVDIVTNH